MIALLIPFLVVSLGAGPVQFFVTASIYGKYGRVFGDSLVESRPELRSGRIGQRFEEVA
jgi:hypothetical protein